MEEILYRGDRRPFKHVTNYGDVFLEDNDIISVNGDVVKINRLLEKLSRVGYLSDFCCLKYNLRSNDRSDLLNYLREVLSGDKQSPLEHDIEEIDHIASLLPERDLTLAFYNFSNQFRPTYFYEFRDGLYYGSNVNGRGKGALAWYAYRNLGVLLPEGVTEVSAEEYDLIEWK